jgi:hypothetical protein
MHQRQRNIAQLGVTGGPLDRDHRARRAVDAYDDPWVRTELRQDILLFHRYAGRYWSYGIR